MTRTLLSALAIAFVVLAPAAASAQTDVTGDWAVTIESPQGPVTIDAVMKQAGEELNGTIVSPMGSVDFKGKVIKDAIEVAYSMDMQGNAVEIKMTGKVAGDTIAGNFNFGGLGDVPWTAKRKPAGSAAAAAPAAAIPAAAPAASAGGAAGDVSGKWDITFNMGGNPSPATGNFTQSGEKVTGTLSSQAGETPVTGTMSGQALKLAFVVETPQGALEITLTGDLSGDDLAGKAALTGLGEAEWTGKRIK
jgi:hypothetical protein